jgi:hypothetical protein
MAVLHCGEDAAAVSSFVHPVSANMTDKRRRRLSYLAH